MSGFEVGGLRGLGCIQTVEERRGRETVTEVNQCCGGGLNVLPSRNSFTMYVQSLQCSSMRSSGINTHSEGPLAASQRPSRVGYYLNFNFLAYKATTWWNHRSTGALQGS